MPKRLLFAIFILVQILKFCSSEHGGKSIDTLDIDFNFIFTLQIQTLKDLYLPDLNEIYRKISRNIQEVSCNFIACLLLFFHEKYRPVIASSFLASPILSYIYNWKPVHFMFFSLILFHDTPGWLSMQSSKHLELHARESMPYFTYPNLICHQKLKEVCVTLRYLKTMFSDVSNRKGPFLHCNKNSLLRMVYGLYNGFSHSSQILKCSQMETKLIPLRNQWAYIVL